MWRLLHYIVVVIFASTAPAWAGGAPPLERGVNLSHWLAQHWADDYSDERLETHFNRHDARQVRATGMDHVRLPVDPQPLLDEQEPTSLRHEHLRKVDRALDLLLEAELDVVLEMHADQDFIGRLATEDGLDEAFVTFWAALAEHVSDRNPERVVLELLNEPTLEHERWAELQRELVAAVREAAPEHAIVVTGSDWGGIDGLLELEPLEEPRLIYSFHMYEPYDFTHQGATWGAEHWAGLRNVPWPYTPERVEPMLGQIADDRSREALEWGVSQQEWDAAALEGRIGQVADWADEHGVRVYCGEFGVYREASGTQDRLRYLRELREAMERAGIGWAMWDYADGFGLAVRESGKAVLDEETVEALGLRVPGL